MSVAVRAGGSGRSSGGAIRRPLLALIAAGLVVRLVLALLTRGQGFDIGSHRIVHDALTAHGLDVYRYVNVGGFHWPYPPGFFPWTLLSGAPSGSQGHVFDVLIRLPAIAADLALAWLVQEYLRIRGATDRARLAAAGAIAFGPVFFLVSGFQGQIDSVAFLPAVLALFAWERLDGERRALVAGALIGVGATVKTVPIFLVLALLPSVRSWREVLMLGASAVAVPVLCTLPFALATPGAPQAGLRSYHGYPGQGGPTLAFQPDLASAYLKHQIAHYSGLTLSVARHATLIAVATYALVAAVLRRFRPPPAVGASLLWLATFALAPAFFFQYLVWGLPFFLMAGFLRASVALQLGVLVPMVLYYLEPWESDTPTYVYVPIMLVVWVAMLVALAALTRGIARRRGVSDLLRPPAGAPYAAADSVR